MTHFLVLLNRQRVVAALTLNEMPIIIIIIFIIRSRTDRHTDHATYGIDMQIWAYSVALTVEHLHVLRTVALLVAI